MRVLLIAPALLALFCGWHGLKWAAGSTLAEYAREVETAEAATRLAPHDPQAFLRVARLRHRSFQPEEMPLSLAAYERAAALAPNNYLVWMEVGRAHAAAGDEAAGLGALRRAVELAPHYSQPRWLLGNALLRAGRNEEAFAELRLAADADAGLRPQVFNLAWQLYGGDLARVLEAVGRSPGARAQLVGVLTGRGQLEEAQSVWSGLTSDERRNERQTGEALANALATRRQYRRAAQVLSEAGVDVPETGRLANGGFESDLGAAGRQLFGWQVWPAPANSGVQVAVDARNARAGSRSLRVTFNASAQVEPNVSQLVAVEPGARYRLSFQVRTDELKSASSMLIVVTEAVSGTVLARSQAAFTGTSDWRQETLEFAAGPNTDGVILRFSREPCPDGVCPLFGKIWYDDFNLERIAGRQPSR